MERKVTQHWACTRPAGYKVLDFGPTCVSYTGSTNIDHAIITKLFANLLIWTETLDVALPNHRPAQATFTSDHGNQTVHTIKKSTRSNTAPVNGPKLCLENDWVGWEHEVSKLTKEVTDPNGKRNYIRDLAEEQWQNFDKIWSEWNRIAALEVSANCGIEPPSSHPPETTKCTLKEAPRAAKPRAHRREESWRWK